MAAPDAPAAADPDLADASGPPADGGSADGGSADGDSSTGASGVTGETLPSDDIEALLAAAAAGSVQMPPEDDEGTDPEEHGDAAGDAAGESAPETDPNPAAWPEPSEAAEPADPPPGRPAPATSIPVGGQVEKLLEEVEAEVRRGRRPVLAAGEQPPDALGRTTPLELEAFAEAAAGAGRPVGDGHPVGDGLGALDDVELDLRIELGRTEMSLEEVVALRDGSVVTLDKLAGDPVDILVNGRLVARGEVLVLNDNFCVRVAEILAPDR